MNSCINWGEDEAVPSKPGLGTEGGLGAVFPAGVRLFPGAPQCPALRLLALDTDSFMLKFCGAQREGERGWERTGRRRRPAKAGRGAKGLHYLKFKGFAALPLTPGVRASVPYLQAGNELLLLLLAPLCACRGAEAASCIHREAVTWLEISSQHWHTVCRVAVQTPASLGTFLFSLHITLEFLNFLMSYSHKTTVAAP